MRRGRPKYDDVLTPREWEVLDLLRQGKTNEQIAGHLGISVNGAKFHVSEIISKLGVRSRREAAARPVAPRIRQLAPGFLLPFGLLKFAALTVLLLAAGGFIALATGVLVNNVRGGPDTAVSPPPATPTPVPEGATPAPTLNTEQQREVALKATATAVAAQPTPTPAPAVAQAGQLVPVWVYADAEPSDNCFDLVEAMIPATAPDSIPGKPVECALPHNAGWNLVQQSDGYYHLESLELRLLTWEEWPSSQRPRLPDCLDVIDTLLLSTEAPKAATLSGVCNYVPPYRGEPGREPRLVWTRVEVSEAPPELLPDTSCEVAATYLGPPEYDAAGLREVICQLR